MISQTIITNIMAKAREPEGDAFTPENLRRLAQNINYGAPVEVLYDIIVNEMGVPEDQAYLYYVAAELLVRGEQGQ